MTRERIRLWTIGGGIGMVLLFLLLRGCTI